MKAAVELYEFSKGVAPRAPHMHRPRAALPAPQLRTQHPPAQGRHRNQVTVLGPQMLGRERGAKPRARAADGSAVVRADQREHRGLLAHRPRPIRAPADITVAQPDATHGLIPTIQTLRLAVADAQHASRRGQQQLPRRDLRQHTAALHFLGGHCDPLHAHLPVEEWT